MAASSSPLGSQPIRAQTPKAADLPPSAIATQVVAPAAAQAIESAEGTVGVVAIDSISPLANTIERQLGDERLTVRALNLDNTADRQHLNELIESNYGESFTNRFPQFLESGTEDDDSGDEDSEEPLIDLVHLVAIEEDRFVAHLALRKYELAHRTQAVYELLLPAILPTYRREAFRLARKLWQHIVDLAARQHVSAVYHYSPLKHPLLQLMAVKCFRSVESGIIPAAPAHFGGLYLAAGRAARRFRSKSILMANVLNHDAFKTSHPIYVPTDLVEVVRVLCGQLGISREIKSDVAAATPLVTVVYRSQSSLHSGITDVSFVPRTSTQSPGTSIDDALAQLTQFEEILGAKASLAIPLAREGAASLIEALVVRGYTFSGLRPLPGGRDELLLSVMPAEELADAVVYSRTAKFLKEFIREYSQKH